MPADEQIDEALRCHGVRLGAEPSAGLDDEDDEAGAPVPVPQYPVDALSVGPLGDLLAGGRDAGIPVPLVGAYGLGIAAACVMPAALQVDPERTTWVERPALWIAAVAPPGGGKSPALGYARGPLDVIEDQAYDRWKAERDAWEQQPAKTRDEAPTRDRWTIEDITPEMLLRALDVNGGCLAVVADELRSHLASMGRYRPGGKADSDHALWLKIWDGRPATYDRVTGSVSIRIARPVVPIVGGLQPAYVSMLGIDEDGSRGRWLPHYSPDASIRANPPRDATEWNTWVEQATARRADRTWVLDDAAATAWSDARDRWDALARATDSGPAVAGAAGKAPRQALRVAVVLAELAAPGRVGTLPLGAMTGAVALVDYTLDVWAVLGGSTRTLTMSRRDEALYGTADDLAGWIEGRGGRVTYRDIGRARPCGIRTKDQRDAVMSVYRQLYPRTVREEKPENGGKAATVVYGPRDPRIASSPPGGVDMSTLSTPPETDTRTAAEPEESEQVTGPGRPADSGPAVSTPPTVDTAMSTPDAAGAGTRLVRDGWANCAGCGHRVIRPDLGEPLCPGCRNGQAAA